MPNNDGAKELAQVQRWLQSVLTHPGGVIAGVQSEDARRQLDVAPEAIDSVISASERQTSVERLEIYSRAYFARLVECLRGEFPMLVLALGAEVFDQFAAGYLQAHPSRSYTLTRLGASFADYLCATQPADDDQAWLGFLIDLARLEWCFNEVFDGPGPEKLESLTAEMLGDIAADQWPTRRLAPVAGLRLLSFAYPVHELYQALRHGEQPPPPARQQTRLVVWRRNYVVRHQALSEEQFKLLTALAEGRSIGQAIELAACQQDDVLSLARNLETWFREWFTAGLFGRVLE